MSFTTLRLNGLVRSLNAKGGLVDTLSYQLGLKWGGPCFSQKPNLWKAKAPTTRKKGGHTFSVRSFDSGRTLFLLLCWRKRAFNREDLETADFEPFKTLIHIQSVKNSRPLTTFNFLLAACSHLFFERPLQNQIHSHYLLLIIPIIN